MKIKMKQTAISFILSIFIIISKFHRISSQIAQDTNLQGIEPEPEFDGSISNVTYPAGREVILTCTVRNLGKYKVGWLRASDQTVLALQGRVVTHNNRISVTHEDFNTWHLRIKSLKDSDRGCYMCQINSSPMKKQIGCIDVQIPPDIVNELSTADVSMQEGKDAYLICHATGNPTPRVTWKREDGESILIKKGGREPQKVDQYNGTTLPLLKLERKQLGNYLCIASNDVPPSVSKRVTLNVQFSPSVRAPSQLLGAPLGSDVQLACTVEAYPPPVSYWVKGGKLQINSLSSSGQATTGGNNDNTNLADSGIGNSDMGQQRMGEMLLDGPKYEIVETRNGYRGTMKLTIKSFSPLDVGTYQCVSTNSFGKAEGTLRLYEIKIQPPGVAASASNIDNPSIISSYPDAARGRGTLSANSPKRIVTKTIVLFMTSLGIFLTTSHIR